MKPRFSMNKRVILGLLLGGSAVFTSCTSEDSPASSAESKKSIVILFESDSHCEVSGYPKIAGLRDAINQSDTARVMAIRAPKGVSCY